MLGGRGLVPFRACIWVQQRRCAVAVARCMRHAWMGSVSVARMQSVNDASLEDAGVANYGTAGPCVHHYHR
jgi:hypothetical protein